MIPSAAAAYGHASSSHFPAGQAQPYPSNGEPTAVGNANTPSELPSGPVILTSTMPAAAYYTPATYEHLLSHTLSLDSNPSAILSFDSRRISACGLIAALGARVGLPQRTINTAFVVWHKFGVQHGAASGNTGQQIALAALFLACKLNDTPKKTIDLIVASYPLRFPELVKPSSNPALASIPESEIDAQVLEAERNKLLGLEKTMLDAIGYDFKIRQGVESVARGVIKLGRAWDLGKSFVQEAWQIASDIHRTPSALFYPPLVLSLAAVLAAALLCPSNAPAQRQASSRHVAAIFGIQTLPGLGEQEQSQTNGNGAREDEVDKKGGPLGDESLEEEMHLWQAEVEDVVHAVLDLYIACCSNIVVLQTQTSRSAAGVSGQFSSPSSPATPISPSSPSDHAASSASRTGSSTKPPLHASNPPPLGVISWLGLHARRPAPPHSQTSTSTPSGKPKATPAADLSKLVTESKIALRALEDARRAEEAQGALETDGVGSGEHGASALINGHGDGGEGNKQGSGDTNDERLRKRRKWLERRREIDHEKRSIQTLKVQVHGPDEAGQRAGAGAGAGDASSRRASKPSSATRVVVAPAQGHQGQAVAKTTRFLF